jgi:hypothetical protein
VIEARARDFGLEHAIAWTAWWLAEHGIASPVRAMRSPARASFAEWLRSAALTTPSPALLQIGTIAFTGFLARNAAVAGSLVSRSATRIAKRRLQRHLPRWVPEAWGG